MLESITLYKSMSYYLNVVLIIIIFILLMVNRKIESELDLFDLIKLYEIGEDDSIRSVIDIRKSNGETCKITTEFPDDRYKGEQKMKKRVMRKGDCI